jgi:plasmid stabilization system protein ParE
MAPVRALRLQFSDRAADQLEAIDLYIRPRNARGADKVGRDINAACERLTRFPYLGRPVFPRGARAMSITSYPYAVIYEVLGMPADTVMIIGIFHTAQGDRKI